MRDEVDTVEFEVVVVIDTVTVGSGSFFWVHILEVFFVAFLFSSRLVYN